MKNKTKEIFLEQYPNAIEIDPEDHMCFLCFWKDLMKAKGKISKNLQVRSFSMLRIEEIYLIGIDFVDIN